MRSRARAAFAHRDSRTAIAIPHVRFAGRPPRLAALPGHRRIEFGAVDGGRRSFLLMVVSVEQAGWAIGNCSRRPRAC